MRMLNYNLQQCFVQQITLFTSITYNSFKNKKNKYLNRNLGWCFSRIFINIITDFKLVKNET